ncbi:TPA: ATP-grasp domain-containing protein [Yersinia enterocolitica]|uniref:ATP-grasp domain-containing protein n=1 Tax=Yersinia enterocolitica TaxID=630 RepID=UPI002AC38DAD|nr:ATP-grasp domain-containing protein [Yersinia enterocolitica]HEN3566095.1 ATP-grasp domain-containing protein [Yersinia enterocolitica]HEN3571111.1 ATP-grasp domain-containing protein [Yersinia enterocolitica]HEN3575093.1 ATP-grasp domain-containing protein [Yersinia enterocolitica]HEN3578250.1 ATP-grasp domain-containing protein [Yersinia enterocolitica]
MEKNKCVLVVDPFSSGAAFANRIKSLFGYDVMALITNDRLPPAIMATFRQEDYSKVFHYQSYTEAVQQIESAIGHAPGFIVCGSEPGVHVFDRLCKEWELLPNIFELSQARRDKHLMQYQLMQDGIRYIPHYKSGNLQDILKWCVDNPFDEYVIKPISSFGTDGVFFCSNISEVEHAFSALTNTLDYSGSRNAQLLIEQKIEGTEYVVDAVSSNGEHYVVNIFRYVKQEINGVPIYHQMITEPMDEHATLISYVKSVLTSLGVRNGTSHNEIIMSDTGPVLVETGARMHGGLGPRLVEECNSHSLIDLSLMARISPNDFADITLTKPVLRRYAAEYFLSSPKSGTLKMVNIASQCSSLKSYGFTVCKYRAGDYLEKTTDLVTSYGRVVLFNSDREQVIADVQSITDLERAGMLITMQ